MKLALDEDEVVPNELKVIYGTLQWTWETPFADAAALGSTGRGIQHANEDERSSQEVVLRCRALRRYRHVQSPGNGGRRGEAGTQAA